MRSGDVLQQRFKIVSQLGQGGMGRVWLATDLQSKKKVALKFPRADLASKALIRQWFDHEVSLLKRFEHPNIQKITSVSDAGSSYDAQPFFVSDYFEKNILDLPTDDAILSALSDVVSALIYCHKQGWVHRDLRPEHMVINDQGRVALIDFGIAAPIGVVIDGGGGRYASPNRSKNSVSECADDIFALGVIIEELAAGIQESQLREVLQKYGSAMQKKDENLRPSLSAFNTELLSLQQSTMEPSMTKPPTMVPAESAGRVIKPADKIELGPTNIEAHRSRRWIPLSIALVTLLAVLAAVVLLLPQRVSRPKAASVAITPPPIQASDVSTQQMVEDAGQSPYQMAEQQRAKNSAEDVLEQFLTQQYALEDMSVRDWDSDAFAAARKFALQGDGQFKAKRYAEAETNYQMGLDALKNIAASHAPRLAEAISKGNQALASNQSTLARDAFAEALLLDGMNNEALAGMKRAKSLDEYWVLIDLARDLEAQERLAAAKASFQQALALDQMGPEAKMGVEEIDRKMGDNQFAALMNKGFTAMRSQLFDDAGAFFRQAAQLRPNEAGPKNALAELNVKSAQQSAVGLLASAKRFEADELYKKAAESYAQALALDPSLTEARQAKDRVETKQALLDNLNVFIDDPLSVAETAKYNDAKGLLVKIRGLDSPGVKIETRARQLTDILRQAKKPVSVTVNSDEQTSVTVYKVGLLGQFKSQELSLTPGRYTAVGTRKGYRDVRVQFSVFADGNVEPIDVRCEERI